nr:hypothetical protein Iba_chr05dCG13080 [Ipomoea batatas]
MKTFLPVASPAQLRLPLPSTSTTSPRSGTKICSAATKKDDNDKATIFSREDSTRRTCDSTPDVSQQLGAKSAGAHPQVAGCRSL